MAISANKKKTVTRRLALRKAAADRKLNASARSVEKLWVADPNFAALVKSQVDDVGLINHRRTQFVRAAIELFSHKGYHTTTIKEIAAATGISPGLIYQYVTDKDDILFLALQLVIHTTKKVVPEAIAKTNDPVHKFIFAFQECCRVTAAHSDAVALTYRETKTLHRKHRDAIKQMELDSNELYAECVKACIKDGLFRDVNVELFVYNTLMAAHAWALKIWRIPKIVNLEEYIWENTDILMHSALTKKGWKHYKNCLDMHCPASIKSRLVQR